VWARVSAWLADQPPEPERRVIAVSHGVTGRLLRGAYAGLSRHETLMQDVPQDAVFRLANGRIERIDCPSPTS
jgi:probable phosphoglycerate mutase